MSETLELAKKIRDLYNTGPRFPTLEEVAALLSQDQLMKEFQITFHVSEKDMLIKQTMEVVKTFGIINVLDVLARISENDVKLMNKVAQHHIKASANYLADKAALENVLTNTRFFP